MVVTKAKAFGIHLSISLVIFLILSWFLIFRWFPGALFFIDGGWQGMRIIATVDLVLGPMLTLIFFKPGKPGLKFDMSMIALVQIAALTYGVWAAQQQSIVAIAFVEGRFVSVANNSLQLGDTEMRAAGKPTQSLEILSDQLPAQIYVDAPPPEEYGDYLASVLNGMPELHERSHRFRPLSDNLEKIDKFQVNIAALGESEQNAKQTLISYLDDSGIDESTVQVYRFKARYGLGLAIVAPDSKKIIDIIRYRS